MKHQSSKSGNAFSLVELLVVITVVAILLGFASISLFKRNDSTLLTSTGDTVLGLFKEAQQKAISDSAHIEFRIYQLQVDVNGETTWFFQFTREQKDGTFQAISSGYLAPQNIVVNRTANLSTLINVLPEEEDDDGLFPASFARNQYTAFRFNSDGSTNLNPIADNGDTWHLTLQIGNDANSSDANAPKNFYTISIDPFTGKSKVFRP